MRADGAGWDTKRSSVGVRVRRVVDHSRMKVVLCVRCARAAGACYVAAACIGTPKAASLACLCMRRCTCSQRGTVQQPILSMLAPKPPVEHVDCLVRI